VTTRSVNRKTFIIRSAIALLAGVSGAGLFGAAASGASTDYKRLTEDDWRKRLTSEQFVVLRKQGTEFAFSSPLDHETRPGTYSCAGCDLSLFSSKTKFDSGTGWPSFWAPLPNAIETSVDKTFFEVRTEVHCRRCAGHLGHVFDDGPKPTGLRYCMNGVALTFRPGKP
jgi:peptide-methionine (R)-S-oxide reductase